MVGKERAVCPGTRINFFTMVSLPAIGTVLDKVP
jgi:hypothetical protein